jgi:hypothetical protein
MHHLRRPITWSMLLVLFVLPLLFDFVRLLLLDALEMFIIGGIFELLVIRTCLYLLVNLF